MKKILGIIVLALAALMLYFLFAKNSGQDSVVNDVEHEQDTEMQMTTKNSDEEAETFCYEYFSESEDFSEIAQIKITFRGAEVMGVKKGSSQSGEYSVGYEGGFNGSLAQDGTIDAVNTTSIADGGAITAQERYLFRDGNLTEYRYAYTEDFQNNMLVIDESVLDNGLGREFPVVTQYTSVSCEEIL